MRAPLESSRSIELLSSGKLQLKNEVSIEDELSTYFCLAGPR